MQNKLTSKTPQNTTNFPQSAVKVQNTNPPQNTGKFVDSRTELGPENGKN